MNVMSVRDFLLDNLTKFAISSTYWNEVLEDMVDIYDNVEDLFTALREDLPECICEEENCTHFRRRTEEIYNKIFA